MSTTARARRRPLPWTLRQVRDMAVPGGKSWVLDLEVLAGEERAIMARRGLCWNDVAWIHDGDRSPQRYAFTGIPVTLAEALSIGAGADPLGVLAYGPHGARPWPWLTARPLTLAEMLA